MPTRRPKVGSVRHDMVLDLNRVVPNLSPTVETPDGPKVNMAALKHVTDRMHEEPLFTPKGAELRLIETAVLVLRYHGWSNEQIAKHAIPVSVSRVEHYYQRGLAHQIRHDPTAAEDLRAWAIAKLRGLAEHAEARGLLKEAREGTEAALRAAGGAAVQGGNNVVIVNQSLDRKIEEVIARRAQDAESSLPSGHTVVLADDGRNPDEDA